MGSFGRSCYERCYEVLSAAPVAAERWILDPVFDVAKRSSWLNFVFHGSEQVSVPNETAGIQIVFQNPVASHGCKLLTINLVLNQNGRAKFTCYWNTRYLPVTSVKEPPRYCAALLVFTLSH